MRRSLIAGSLIAALSTVTLAGVPAAQAAPAAGTPLVLTLIGSKAVVGIVDTGAKGPTPGDVRTISLTMSDTKGVERGRAEVVQTLTRQQGGIGTAVKVAVIELQKGTITVMGDVDFTDITSSTARPLDTTEQLAVVGGTGIFRGAAGEVDIVVLPGFTSRWTISLDRR